MEPEEEELTTSCGAAFDAGEATKALELLQKVKHSRENGVPPPASILSAGCSARAAQGAGACGLARRGASPL